MSRAFSAGSGDSTWGCTVPGCEPSRCVRRMSGGVGCLRRVGPESPSATTFGPRLFMPYRTLMPDGTVDEHFKERDRTDALQGPSGNKMPLVVSSSSPGVSPAKTGPSQDAAPASKEPAPDCSSTGPTASQSSLFDHDGSFSRTSRDCYPLVTGETSGPSSGRWPTSGMAWRGGYSTLGSSEFPSAAVECSLSDILVGSPDRRYALSARAARGILRRASARGRELPGPLEVALRLLADEGNVTERAA